MDRVLSLTVFRRVAELQSFSAAARDLGLSNAAISKHVAALEERVRARLLERTTRKVSLTAAGAAYLARCTRILDEIAELDEQATQAATTLRGTLRVNAPLSFGLLHVSPLLPQMMARWPELVIELALTDQLVDLAEEGVDVMLRVTSRLADSSSIIASRLATVGFALVGTPAYFKRHGVPKMPADLARHNCIVYSSPHWSFVRDDRTVRVTVAGSARINSSLAIRDALLADIGISLMPRFYVHDLLKSRRLRAVLSDHDVPPVHIYALYARQRHLSPKIRSFVELMRDHLARVPWAEHADARL
jgi:DNA-binding transcriptional LysR family regulator